MKKFVLGLLLAGLVSCSPFEEEPAMVVEKGVSLELAKYRRETISKINYNLHLTIPEAQNESILARETVNFTLSETSQDLQLDFMAEEDSITSVVVNGSVQTIVHVEEHLIIDKSALKVGQNAINILFRAGNSSLNRNPEYLYTIFVPDRARTAFPIFDQPNLKATYDLTLDLPKGWTSIANGPLRGLTKKGARDVFTFAKSDLIPTYLFTFVAGKFEVITRDVDGVEMTMLHRETDEDKVARNLDEIFKLHKASLDWLEDYTGIPYPFKKFGFALIPSFQFGGMEHVGAIHYRASSLFLDEDPSTPRQLGRASLIAHETAHMWFGDLVTMDWFNDVWTKEVFANFMASKIVNPSFPDVDHDLNFLLRSYPSAYSVDRTEGANPIRQHLPNLNEAGTMYGAIIYNKAPVMMMQLEMLMGKEAFQKGMQEYLETYAYSNATWPNLVGILDKLTDTDLVKWSEVWVNTAGRPTFTLDSKTDGDIAVEVSQIDPQAGSKGKGRVWPQSFTIVGKDQLDEALAVSMNKATLEIGTPKIKDPYNDILMNSNGKGYGLFPLPDDFFGGDIGDLSDLQKGSLLVSYYEQILENTSKWTPNDFLQTNIELLGSEQNPLLIRLMLNRIANVYWTLISIEDREGVSVSLATLLWDLMEKAETPSLKKMFFGTFMSIAIDDASVKRLKDVWSKTLTPLGLKLNEQDYINLAADLALKIPAEAEEITLTQLAAIQNPDRKRRFEFIMPALAADPALRDGFVLSLGHERNRQIESWVLGALGYIHHPLRTEQSTKYIKHGLDLLQQIQITGDIFFPGRWMGVILGNHRSDAAVTTVRNFLAEHPDYNHQLKLKILQSADPLFRANKILKEVS